MRLEYSRFALGDLEEIALYIARDNPARAHSFVDELETKCARLTENPKLYRLDNDISPGLHMMPHGDYLVFYRETGGGIRVERVLHGARDYAALF